MIDFRYHLVSIIAVFFALAVGILLGAGPLGERVEEDLPAQLESMRDQNSDLQNQLLAFETSQNYQQSFVEDVADELVSDRLSGESVLLVGLPGADADRLGQLRDMLERSGASVTGAVRVDDSWGAPDSEAALDALAAELTSRPLPTDGDGYDRGASVLANALLTSLRPEDVVVDPASELEEVPADPTAWSVDDAVVTGFGESGFIEVEGEPSAKANLVVVVADSTSLAQPPEDGADAETGDESGEPDEWFDRLITLVATLEDVGRGTVVAGQRATTADHDVLGRLRSNDDLSGEISTVDSVELATGQVAVVYAIAEQADGGVGHYGLTESAGTVSPPVPARPEPESADPTEQNGDDGSTDTEEPGGGGSEGSGSEGDGSEGGAESEEDGGDDPVGAGVVGGEYGEGNES